MRLKSGETTRSRAGLEAPAVEAPPERSHDGIGWDRSKYHRVMGPAVLETRNWVKHGSDSRVTRRS